MQAPAVHIMIDFGMEEEKWRERERGQKVRTGRQIDDEGGRDGGNQRMKEQEEGRGSHGGEPGRRGWGLQRYTVFLGETIITMSNGSSHRPLP